jgi:hypothetical protein
MISNFKKSVPALFIMTGLTFLFGCTADKPQVTYGLQQEHASYIPARMAVVPCRLWPQAKYPKLQGTNIDKKQIQSLCTKFDAFVLDGFSGQPNMKGYSPRLVAKLLKKSNDPKALTEIGELWKKHAKPCEDCQSPPEFYVKSISHSPHWRAWLNQFSRQVRNADAIAIPYVFFANEKQFTDRGLLMSERSAGIVLLLISTNNAELLWSGGRQVEVPDSKLPLGKKVFPAYPEWSMVEDRLFSNDVWQEFPGRQVFN